MCDKSCNGERYTVVADFFKVTSPWETVEDLGEGRMFELDS